MYNLTRYELDANVLLGKEENGYPYLEAVIIGKAPKMVKIRTTQSDSYFGESKERWLSANEWYVIARIKVD